MLGGVGGEGCTQAGTGLRSFSRPLAQPLHTNSVWVTVNAPPGPC